MPRNCSVKLGRWLWPGLVCCARRILVVCVGFGGGRCGSRFELELELELGRLTVASSDISVTRLMKLDCLLSGKG